LSTTHTPFLISLLERFPSSRLRTHPTTELFPTLISGVDPHQHLIWQVSLKEDAWTSSWLDGIPDWMTTTAQ
jgi:hypothetical protein